METLGYDDHGKAVWVSNEEADIIARLLSLAYDAWKRDDPEYEVVKSLYYNW